MRTPNCQTGLLPTFVLALALTPLLPAPAVAQQPFPATEELELMLRYLVEDQETPGVVLGLLDADGSRRIIAHGSGGPEALPLGPKSVFEIGSITKVFTGILLADLVDRGQVSLTDPVSMYAPEGVRIPSRSGREITLLDLATHRSALPPMPRNLPGRRGVQYTPEDMYAFLSEHELRREIGAEYEYSNLGVALLTDVIVRVAGDRYEDLIRERILDPLGMDMTSTIVAGEMRRWNTQGHEEGEVTSYWGDWRAFTGTGSIRSTAEDLLTFLAANVGEPESRLERLMRDSHEVRDRISPEQGTGLLWQVRRLGDRTVIAHGGETEGYSAVIAFDPDRHTGVVLLGNAAELGGDLAYDLLRAPAPAAPQLDVSPRVLATYAGAYEVASGGRLFVRLEEEGYLTLQAPRSVRVPLEADSDTSFAARSGPRGVTFRRDAAGDVIGMVVAVDGTERRARKVAAEVPPPAVVAGHAAMDRPLAVKDMRRYEGRYAVQMGPRTREIEVFVQADRLMLKPPGAGASALLYQGDHEFVAEANIGMRFLFSVEDGRAERLTVRVGGRSMSGPRTR